MKHSIYITFILCIVFGCKEETKQDIKYIDKKYNSFMFKENSYWVFIKEGDNEIDSLVLQTVETGFYFNPPPSHGVDGTQREFYKMIIASITNNYYYIDLIDSYGLRRNPETQYNICGRNLYCDENQNNCEYIDSMSICGRIFKNVIKRKILANDYVAECTNSGFTYDTDIYIVADYGVVKQVVYENYGPVNWELVRFKIIK